VGRTIAVGDIHGCLDAFRAVLTAAAIGPADTLVLLGDYVDRGPDSKGVLEEILALAERLNVVPLLGNHDEMMLHAREGKADFRFWLSCGGEMALSSYYGDGSFWSAGIDALARVPPSHFQLLESCRKFFETDSHLFVHASFKPEQPAEQFDERTLRWRSLRDYVPPQRHISGKTVVVGHTPQEEVLDLGYLIGIDTGCCYGGWLTAFDVDTKQVWQADAGGALRR